MPRWIIGADVIAALGRCRPVKRDRDRASAIRGARRTVNGRDVPEQSLLVVYPMVYVVPGGKCVPWSVTVVPVVPELGDIVKPPPPPPPSAYEGPESAINPMSAISAGTATAILARRQVIGPAPGPRRLSA